MQNSQSPIFFFFFPNVFFFNIYSHLFKSYCFICNILYGHVICCDYPAVHGINKSNSKLNSKYFASMNILTVFFRFKDIHRDARARTYTHTLLNGITLPLYHHSLPIVFFAHKTTLNRRRARCSHYSSRKTSMWAPRRHNRH